MVVANPVYLAISFFVNLTAANADTLQGILDMTGTLVTWIITQMGNWLTFITSNPVVLILFLIFLAGTGLAFLLRVWKSV